MVTELIWSQDPLDSPEELTVLADHAPGAEVSVDGGAYLPLPLRGLRLAIGPHRMTVRAPGFRTFQADFTMISRRSYSFELSPEDLPRAVGVLLIEPSVQGAIVKIDGRVVSGPNFRVELPAGSHRIEVTAEGYEPQTFAAEVGAGLTKRLTVQLTQASVPTYVWAGAVLMVAVAVSAGVALNSTPPKPPIAEDRKARRGEGR